MGGSLRVYLDTNVVHVLHATWTPAQFDRRARVRDIILTIGPNVIYELARAFVSGRETGQVREACRFLSEAEQIEHLPTLEELICAEFDQAALGVPIVTVRGGLNHVAAQLALARLARGDAQEAAAFIARREASIRVVTPQISQENRTRLRALRKVRTFPIFRQRLWPTAGPQLRELAAFHQRGDIPQACIRRILTTATEFPVLNAWVNAQWYCAWVATHHATTTGKLDDLRHLLESARSNRFVTSDDWLLGAAPMISPSRPCWTWDQLRSVLE
jgi:hypothetical protein